MVIEEAESEVGDAVRWNVIEGGFAAMLWCREREGCVGASVRRCHVYLINYVRQSE